MSARTRGSTLKKTKVRAQFRIWLPRSTVSQLRMLAIKCNDAGLRQTWPALLDRAAQSMLAQSDKDIINEIKGGTL